MIYIIQNNPWELVKPSNKTEIFRLSLPQCKNPWDWGKYKHWYINMDQIMNGLEIWIIATGCLIFTMEQPYMLPILYC